MYLILTTPHSFCPAINCDETSLFSARLIARYLKIPHKIFEGDVPRQECDLNRIQCRNTSYRKDIKELALRKRGNVFVLDVHSFVDPFGAWGVPGDMEIVIIDDRFTHDKALDLATFLEDDGINATHIQGANNDIQDEMHSLNIDSFLIEFSDLLSDSRRKYIALLVATFFN